MKKIDKNLSGTPSTNRPGTKGPPSPSIQTQELDLSGPKFDLI